MNTTEVLNKAIELATDAAPSLIERLNTLRRQTDKALMKVAVLGDFKAGKSTLINSLFLRRPLLPTEFSECTAVPTHVMNGAPRLLLMKREADGTETLVEDIPNPEPAKLAACITAKDETARADMAKHYSRAILTMPDILPDGICLVDTPGLNSTNTAIVTGTMQEAHEADAVLYVHHRTQLTPREEQLIRTLSGSQNPKLPFFIVITHDASQSDQMAEDICREVKASLALNHIEVQCAAFNRDDKETTKVAHGFGALPTLGQAAEKQRGFGNFGAFGKVTSAAPAATDSESKPLAKQLTHFFETAVGQGRIAKIRRDLLPLLQELQSTLAGRLALCDADAQKQAYLENELRCRKQEYEREIENILADFRIVQLRFKEQVQRQIQHIGDKKKEALGRLKDVTSIQKEICAWQETVPADISNTIELLQIDLSQEMRDIAYRHSCLLADKFRPDEQLPITFDPGFLAKIPAWLTLTCDYLLVSILSPLPFFIDLPLRFVFSELPILPGNLLAGMAAKVAMTNLEQAIRKAAADVEEALDRQFRNLNLELRQKLRENGSFADMEHALEEVRSGSLDAEARTLLQQRIEEITRLLRLTEA